MPPPSHSHASRALLLHWLTALAIAHSTSSQLPPFLSFLLILTMPFRDLAQAIITDTGEASLPSSFLFIAIPAFLVGTGPG